MAPGVACQGAKEAARQVFTPVVEVILTLGRYLSLELADGDSMPQGLPAGEHDARVGGEPTLGGSVTAGGAGVGSWPLKIARVGQLTARIATCGRVAVYTRIACSTSRPRGVSAHALGAPLACPTPLLRIRPRCSRRVRSFEICP
jgi:hypothetical protein